MKRYVKAASGKMNKSEQITVYMEFVNYLGEVNDSIEIANFRSINWAKDFLKSLPGTLDSDGTRYRIQTPQGTAYVTEDGGNEFVNSL